MSYGQQAARYREMEVLSATPGQLVVLLYDHLLVTLRRARVAIEAKDIERRSELLDKSRSIIAELLATLDLEKGGDIAVQLSALYTFQLTELVDIGLKPDVKRLERITNMIAELREAWATIASQSPTVAASA
jgi:flagellar secretion chaperone FliS